ncbi:putative ribonuclease H-like domain-containing protein [Tanacetum coccineum]
MRRAAWKSGTRIGSRRSCTEGGIVRHYSDSDTESAEPSELVSEPVVNESNVECQPKVWSDAPIIEEYESDSEDECVSIPTKQQETPSFANQQVKTPRENVKSQFTHSQKPKVDKKDLGHGFARMARKAELNNGWNNVQRVNKQNQFVPSAVLTRTGIIPVNTARTSGTLNWEQGSTLLNFKTLMVAPVLFGSLSYRLHSSITKIPRNNMYSFNLENIVPSGGLACLIAKATTDESNKWHRRLGHVNFKNLNKLVKGNLVRGLPSKLFQNDHTCVACQKGKQHKAHL